MEWVGEGSAEAPDPAPEFATAKNATASRIWAIGELRDVVSAQRHEKIEDGRERRVGGSCRRKLKPTTMESAKAAADSSDAAESARILESVKNETEADDKDLSPDGLAYNVSNMELEVERFLEVESWNIEHGIAITDEVEENIVEEMRCARTAGDEKRGKIKDGYRQASVSLEGAQKALEELNLRLDQAAKDAEIASSAEASGEIPGATAPHANQSALSPRALEHKANPYTEYRALLSARSTSSAAGKTETGASEAVDTRREATDLAVDDSATRSRIAHLRAESELLRKCAKGGSKGHGDFSEFRKALVSKNKK